MRSLIAISLLTLVTAILVAGCITDLHPMPNVQSGNDQGQLVEVNLLSSKGEYSFARGCFWTVQYQIFNRGDTEARNIQLHVELVNSQNDAIRDTKNIFVGTLAPGESRTISLDLDGECGRDYGVTAIPSFE